MYDPTIGQFLTEDPIDFEGMDANLRRYVHNEPTRFVDPEGLTTKPIFTQPSGQESGSIIIVYPGGVDTETVPTSATIYKYIDKSIRGGPHDVYFNTSEHGSKNFNASGLIKRHCSTVSASAKPGTTPEIRVVLLGYSQGANTAAINADRIYDAIKSAGLKPRVLLILVDQHNISGHTHKIKNTTGLTIINAYTAGGKGPHGSKQAGIGIPLDYVKDSTFRKFCDAAKTDEPHGAADDYLLSKSGIAMVNEIFNSRPEAKNRTPLTGGIPEIIVNWPAHGTIFAPKSTKPAAPTPSPPR